MAVKANFKGAAVELGDKQEKQAGKITPKSSVNGSELKRSQRCKTAGITTKQQRGTLIIKDTNNEIIHQHQIFWCCEEGGYLGSIHEINSLGRDLGA